MWINTHERLTSAQMDSAVIPKDQGVHPRLRELMEFRWTIDRVIGLTMDSEAFKQGVKRLQSIPQPHDWSRR